jgi:hypothetical protein
MSLFLSVVMFFLLDKSFKIKDTKKRRLTDQLTQLNKFPQKSINNKGMLLPTAALFRFK